MESTCWRRYTDYGRYFQAAVKYGYYECFVSEDTRLPMMYMDDAIKATEKIMQVDLSLGILGQDIISRGYPSLRGN